MRFAADGQTFGLISEVADRYRHRRRRIFGPDETANRAQAIYNITENSRHSRLAF